MFSFQISICKEEIPLTAALWNRFPHGYFVELGLKSRVIYYVSSLSSWTSLSLLTLMSKKKKDHTFHSLNCEEFYYFFWFSFFYLPFCFEVLTCKAHKTWILKQIRQLNIYIFWGVKNSWELFRSLGFLHLAHIDPKQCVHDFEAG